MSEGIQRDGVQGYTPPAFQDVRRINVRDVSKRKAFKSLPHFPFINLTFASKYENVISND